MNHTTEIINDTAVKIEWTFSEIMERHDSNWCEWLVTGEDEFGQKYTGCCQADGNHPNLNDGVKDIEVITENINQTKQQ